MQFQAALIAKLFTLNKKIKLFDPPPLWEEERETISPLIVARGGCMLGRATISLIVARANVALPRVGYGYVGPGHYKA